ncbi:uL22 family ribosomal protein [Candidatus Vidania fulgoroideorum]
MKKKSFKSKLTNINCSFKKMKKYINHIKAYNLKTIFYFLIANKTKSFIFLKKIFLNCVNNANNNGIFFKNLYLNYLYVCKGKKIKKLNPRAKGKCDIINVSYINLYICLCYNGQ